MSILKNPLSPRETALRLLEHIDAEASYGDIIRQVKILEGIEQTMNDVELYGFEADLVVAEARDEVRYGPRNAARKTPAVDVSWQSLANGIPDPPSRADAGWLPLGDRLNDAAEPRLARAAWRD